MSGRIRASSLKVWPNERDDLDCFSFFSIAFAFDFSGPPYLAALPPEPQRLLEPDYFSGAIRHQSRRRTGFQRQAVGGQLSGQDSVSDCARLFGKRVRW